MLLAALDLDTVDKHNTVELHLSMDQLGVCSDLT